MDSSKKNGEFPEKNGNFQKKIKGFIQGFQKNEKFLKIGKNRLNRENQKNFFTTCIFY